MAGRGTVGPPRKPRSRGLSAEDRKLWADIARTVTPIEGQKRLRASTTLSDPLPPPEKAPPEKAPAARRPAKTAPVWPGPVSGRPGPVGRPEPGLDRRTAERLRRGERAPDARIDLHGMTAALAHQRLDRFIAEALVQGHRMVLVITGKGRPARDRGATADIGLLRSEVPAWLRAGPHGGRILGIYQAHRRHGGEGAYYVYLRRLR